MGNITFFKFDIEEKTIYLVPADGEAGSPRIILCLLEISFNAKKVLDELRLFHYIYRISYKVKLKA